MVKFNYQNKSFTLIELIIYIFVISILGVLTMAIFYGITFYSYLYLSQLSLRNNMFQILNKLYFNNMMANSIEVTTSSIKFNFSPNDYEKLYLVGDKIYLENEATNSIFTSKKVKVNKFQIINNANYYEVIIDLSDLNNNHSLSLTSTLYLWSF
jgi:Tfp pilus assembly protein PilE